MENFWQQLRSLVSDETFLHLLKQAEILVSKVLSIAMVIVLGVAIVDLWRVLFQELATEPYGFFSTTLIEIFGLFLNVLIALEVLENISAYLKNHVVQLELVIITSLTAVARKIIIFDSKDASSLELVGLGVAVIALAGSYWIVKRTRLWKQSSEDDDEG
ncbi:MAG: phosphate-starvation-inducible PsiE family protein [Cyanobacteria bacterium J06638_20]